MDAGGKLDSVQGLRVSTWLRGYVRQKCSLQGLGVGRFFGLFDTDLAAHGSEHLSQKLSDPTLLEWEVPLAIKHPQDDIPQPRLCAR